MNNENAEVEEPSSDTLGYIKLRAGTLRVDSIIQFDLFIMPEDGGSPVLYTRQNTAVTAEVFKSLVDLQERAIFLDEADLDIFLAYIEKNMAYVTGTDNLSAEEKASVMYDCAQHVARGLLALTDAQNLIPRARALVIAISDFVYSSEDFFKHFMKICIYNYSDATHCVNVLFYSLCFVHRMGIRDVGWIQNFATGALLLDLGKCNIDKKILEQEGPLNPLQWKTMKMHPIWGEETLKKHGIVDEVILNVVRHHHEKLNGKGYPDSWYGDQIPKYVRIVTICDIFDALTTKRSYSGAIDSFPALKLMHEEMTGEIDPELFKLFVQMMSSTK